LELNINGAVRAIASELADPSMPLLWALRDGLGLTGTKFGCGVGACGACTVWIEGRAARSCLVPLGSLGGRAVTTIEGLSATRDGTPMHPLQRAWELHQVPQCGHCQSGMLMAAAALLARNPAPSDADIDAGVTNLCRCGTYQRVRAAIHSAAADLAPPPSAPAVRRRA
jgi:isoquinoline 1-oxidoreductase alpha subunit